MVIDALILFGAWCFEFVIFAKVKFVKFFLFLKLSAAKELICKSRPMPFYFKAKKLNMTAGDQLSAVMLNEEEAGHLGIRAGDRLNINWNGHKIVCEATLADGQMPRGCMGLYREVWKYFPIAEGEAVETEMLSRPDSIEAIKKKLLGKKLNFKEVNSIVHDIAHYRLSYAEIAYFVASGFVREYSREELYYMVKAMAENGEQLRFPGTVVDKHSIGGMATKKVTLIVTPIIAAAGLTMPKTSSRAITSPAGTADTMEILSCVSFSSEEIKRIVKENGACLVWGGGLNLVPADDRIIKVSYPLSLEPYNKMVVSIMAKKVAMGIKYLVIDMPVGKNTKIPDMKKARKISDIFVYLGKRFGMKVKVVIVPAKEPIGQGMGPALEIRDALRILQQKKEQSPDLVDKSLLFAATILEMSGKVKKGSGRAAAKEILESGRAWKKMQGIIKSQGGNPAVDSEKVTLGAIKKYVNAKKGGKITAIDGRAVNDICRILGNPNDKLGGMFLNKKVGETVKKGERVFTLYAQNQDRMDLAAKAIQKMKVYAIR